MTTAWRLRETETNRLLLRERRLDLLHAIDLLQLALRLRCLARFARKRSANACSDAISFC
jgi:hypothetical protein